MASYDNPAGIVVAAAIMQLLSIICVGLRCYASYKKGVPFGASEWFILAALIASIGLTVMEIYGVAVQALALPIGGALEDQAALGARLIIAKRLQLAFLILGVFNLGLIKISVTFLYYRIFGKTPIFRQIIVGWIVLLVLWTVAFCLAGLLECGTHLMALFGTVADYNQYCQPAVHAGWGLVGSDIATDLVTMVIPIPMIWTLKLATYKKLLVVATFLIGFLSLGASIAKAYIYITVSLGTYTQDAVLALTGLSIWNLVEVQVGLIAACGPALRPVLVDMVPGSLRSLLGTMRSRFGTTQRSQASKQSNATKDYVNFVSDENLVSAGSVYKGRSAVQTRVERDEDVEMQYLGKDFKNGGIHIKSGYHVDRT